MVPLHVLPFSVATYGEEKAIIPNEAHFLLEYMCLLSPQEENTHLIARCA